jgi:tuberous sclerosis 2
MTMTTVKSFFVFEIVCRLQCVDFCRGALATTALLNIFSTLSFSPNPLAINAQKVFTALLRILSDTPCNRSRLLILQYSLRLRADRDHRVFLVGTIDNEVLPLARPLGFANEDTTSSHSDNVMSGPENVGGRGTSNSIGAKSTSRSRNASRAARTFSKTASSSRSRSRVPELVQQNVSSATSIPIPRRPLWLVPESLNFWLPVRELEEDLIFVQPSPAIVTYEASTDVANEANEHERGDSLSLLISNYVNALSDILERETEWDILAYVLTHLPLQLANKHFFCGPLARESIQKLQQVVCTGLAKETLGLSVLDLPISIHPRNAQSIGYHILTVLISYSPIFDYTRRDLIVPVLCEGIRAGMESTIICCISALTLCAFELQTQISRHLPSILEMLERIMSNAAVAAHVLAFLGIVATNPDLYSNFTEEHFKQVFTIALKYLEAHNDPDANSGLPLALTQHVLFMTFNVIYAWFLALSLEDRPRFVGYITEQVLLANNNILTEPAEVCFDWLARCTYASVDSKPAPSLLRESVMPEDGSVKESFFLMGKSIISLRSNGRKGWLEITTRRPSGMTSFLCHMQNHPIVPVGDPSPDLISLSAAALEDRVPARMLPPTERVSSVVQGENKTENIASTPGPDKVRYLSSVVVTILKTTIQLTGELLDIITAAERHSTVVETPDSLTGYVWTGTAPSQRRKDVTSLPGFFALQLSPYPDNIDVMRSLNITNLRGLKRSMEAIDRVPVIDLHAVGVLYVAPEQKDAKEILSNQHGSPAYTRFLQRLGRLVKIRGQQDVYFGGLDPDENGEFTVAWWDDIEQMVFHVTTMMPNKTLQGDDAILNKESHVGNDHVKVVWNDSGMPYEFTTIPGQFNSVNIIIEPHSFGTIAAYSDDGHENEYFKISMQRQENMPDFGPIGDYKIVSAVNLPLYVRRVSFIADWFCKVYSATEVDKENPEFITNWRYRLQCIKRIKERAAVLIPESPATLAESYNFTRLY